ncbi:hypothetical protein DY000_02007011 [Brassica cretica]|uniref:CCHC-type domain-containing protein n=1 Tax=Brassica cretica TaxID=69181 RepID=A0ABQ7CBA4_BRACR|nr:hypothetical protein DY000_02007011 [Brassica cretica]
MEGVDRAHSEENVYPKAWRLSVSPPNFQRAESEPFVGLQRPHSSHANSEGSTSRRNNPETAAPAPTYGNRPADPTLSMTSQSRDDKLRVNQRRGRKGQFKRHGKTPKAQVKCYTCGRLGHYSHECTNSATEKLDWKASLTCYSCGEKGHFANELEETPSSAPGPSRGPVTGLLMVGGIAAIVLFDSGATHSCLFAFEAQLLFEKLQALCEYYGTMEKPVNQMYLRMLVGSSVPGTELGVPSSGDLERSLIRDPRVWVLPGGWKK